jgi:ABC-2 type transport system permease protein
VKSTATYSGTSGVGSRASLKRTLQIAWVLAKSDLKQRYLGSALGALWTLVRPLMLFGVLYVVFSHFTRVGGPVTNYPLYLLTALSLWGAFAELTTNSLTSLVIRGGILQKISIPVISIPLSVAIAGTVQFGANLLVLLAFLIGLGIPVQTGWLLLPVAAFLIIILAGGTGLLLAISYARFRDIGPIWEVFSQLLFWGTPIIYVATFPQSERVRELLGLNPLAVIITQLRHSVIDASAPSAVAVFGTPVVIASACIFVGTVAAGYFAFQRNKDRVIEFL